MPANAASRKGPRDALGALFASELAGSGKPAQSTYAYQLGDFEGASPVILILSAGTRRQRQGLGTDRYNSFFRYLVLTFVADADEAAGWTDADVEDRLDLIEKEIADIVADNRKTASWHDLTYVDEFSQIIPAVVAGKPYKMETSVLIAEVHDVAP